MDLHELPGLAEDFPLYQQLKEHAAAGGILQLDGLPVAAKSFVLAQLSRETGRQVVVVTYNADQAQRICADLARYGVPEGQLANLFSSVETLFFAEGSPDLGTLGRRVSALRKLAEGKAQFVVGPIGAFLQRTIPASEMMTREIVLSKGTSHDVSDLEKSLLAFGYDRVEAVELPGQWTRRGGILDIFPSDAKQPFRIDFFGDDIESIRPFEVESQRSIGESESVHIAASREIDLSRVSVAEAIGKLQTELPARLADLRKANLDSRGVEHAEKLEERIESDIAQLRAGMHFDQMEYYLPYLYPTPLCALDYLTSESIVVFDEPNQAQARWEQTEKEIDEIAATRAARGEWMHAETPYACDLDMLAKTVARCDFSIIMSLLGRGIDGVKSTTTIQTHAGAMEAFTGRLPSFFEAVDGWLGARFRVVIVSEQVAKIREILQDHKIPTSPQNRLQAGCEGGVYVLDGSLMGGFKLAEAALMVATDTDIFGHRAHQKPPKRAFKDGLKITSYLELREGDYVVHINHGIGYYTGITRLKGPDGAERDYLLLQYAGGDKVYVPTDQVDRVQKYIGSGDGTPTVTRLHSGEWTRATKKAQKQVQEMAADLIKLYALRKSTTGQSAPPDTPWQSEMEDAFPYEETADQLSAIEDVKRDLESDKPMDRLICGDVGYGKTEVAIRAAFKVVNAGRQVAILCPTTILAQQHLATFRERLAAYPVSVEMLSRFVSKAEADRTIRGLEDGSVDIVVGTHKLLSKEIKFRSLGMLVVDEEQRFGVAHKERIKSLKRTVDVLSMSATPIPRTLHMALSGIRDMSLINDPPEGRLPIKTYVREYDDELIREVILRELDRGGQVYYLHNRVESISHVAEHLRRLVGQAKVEIAHGQMHEDDLEEVMLRFADRTFNVLVCTTIVESGLDIPNVNTIIVTTPTNSVCRNFTSCADASGVRSSRVTHTCSTVRIKC